MKLCPPFKENNLHLDGAYIISLFKSSPPPTIILRKGVINFLFMKSSLPLENAGLQEWPLTNNIFSKGAQKLHVSRKLSPFEK